MSPKKRRRSSNKKLCFVPGCNNSSVDNPEKWFFCVPQAEAVRKKWCEMARRDYTSTANLSCCEDHFNVEEDVENWLKVKLLREEGMKCKFLLRSGVLPHFFDCQPERKQAHKHHGRPASEKRRRRWILQEILEINKENSPNETVQEMLEANEENCSDGILQEIFEPNGEYSAEEILHELDNGTSSNGNLHSSTSPSIEGRETSPSLHENEENIQPMDIDFDKILRVQITEDSRTFLNNKLQDDLPGESLFFNNVCSTVRCVNCRSGIDGLPHQEVKDKQVGLPSQYQSVEVQTDESWLKADRIMVFAKGAITSNAVASPKEATECMTVATPTGTDGCKTVQPLTGAADCATSLPSKEAVGCAAVPSLEEASQDVANSDSEMQECIDGDSTITSTYVPETSISENNTSFDTVTDSVKDLNTSLETVPDSVKVEHYSNVALPISLSIMKKHPRPRCKYKRWRPIYENRHDDI